MRNYASFAIGAVVLLAPFAASHHFLLMEPASCWSRTTAAIRRSRSVRRTSEDRGTPSNAITEARGGDMLHFKITETVFPPRAIIEQPWQ